MSYDSLLKDLFRKSPHSDLCREDAARGLHAGKHLRPERKKFVYSDGKEAELVALSGTIPVMYKGATYNIPVCIWLQGNHPFVPPLVYVMPTATMAIKPSKHVDTNGRVYLPFLHEWMHPRSDLATLIQVLCCIFADEPPVYSRSGPDAVFMDAILKNYPHSKMCQKDAGKVLQTYSGLRPERKKFVYDDGGEVELAALNGTIPVKFRGTTYQIPVCIWLQGEHPFARPLVYVVPTATMAIRPNQHVDQSGRVYLRYLHDWNETHSNLAALIEIMCCVFAEEPPVYSKRAPDPTAAPPPTQGIDYYNNFNAVEYKLQ